jgi:fructose-1,6-bisphosphatase/sedoheptulose 1,7-bisphosphatase-like protein
MRINLINTYLYKILYIDTMKARLNITIDKEVLQNVKQLAEVQKTSVSELVENYFKTITQPVKKKSLSEYIKALPKPNLPKDFNWKEEYYKAKTKKYGL